MPSRSALSRGVSREDKNPIGNRATGIFLGHEHRTAVVATTPKVPNLTSYPRALALVTASSLLVPVIGLATAPILTHALGVAGRGQAGAAVAPNLLIVGVATLGLPAALTFHIAKRPYLSRIALAWAALFALPAGGLTLFAFYLTQPFFSGGDHGLAQLMLTGAWLALPALLVGLLRGAAMGLQMWTAVAVERVLNSVLRLCLLGGLSLFDRLDVTNAVLVSCIGPVLAGLAYSRIAFRPAKSSAARALPAIKLAPELLSFGSQVWLGSVAMMLVARLSQLLVVPLSNAEQLGLLIVAITISDIPFIVTQTVREFTFGTNSAESDTHRLLTVSRIATLVSVAGSAVLGLTLPLWISVVFGSGFSAAIVPTWLLLLASCVTVPGLIAGAGLDSAGRPGLRSVSLVIALIATITGLLILVPMQGAVGAGLATLLGAVVSSVFAVGAASRVLGTRSSRFIVLRRSDMTILTSMLVTVRRHVRSALGAH